MRRQERMREEKKDGERIKGNESGNTQRRKGRVERERGRKKNKKEVSSPENKVSG